MEDPWNPTKDEIMEWAYDVGAEYPGQDWEIVAVAHLENAELLLNLASDENCPKRRWTLVNLYLVVGNEIRTKKYSDNIEYFKKILIKASKIENLNIQKWVKRSHDLINHPEKFDYRAWCLGYLAAERVEYECD